MKNKARTAAKL